MPSSNHTEILMDTMTQWPASHCPQGRGVVDTRTLSIAFNPSKVTASSLVPPRLLPCSKIHVKLSGFQNSKKPRTDRQPQYMASSHVQFRVQSNSWLHTNKWSPTHRHGEEKLSKERCNLHQVSYVPKHTALWTCTELDDIQRCLPI